MSSGEYSEFFDPLIGTPQAAEYFRAFLAQSVHNPNSPIKDPYDRLAAGLTDVVDQFTEEMEVRDSLDPDMDGQWHNVGRNIKVGGVRLAVAGVWAVDTHYGRLATVPQEAAGVQRSVRTAMGYVLGLAMMDTKTASLNIKIAQRGLNPGNRVLRVLYNRGQGPRTGKDSLERVFASTVDEAGQVSLRVRYRPLQSSGEHRCPATRDRIELANGRSESSLWRYLQTIGDVAIDEIYPRKFDIVG